MSATEGIQRIKDQLRAEGHDVEEYDLDSIGDQGESDGHGGDEDGISSTESSEAEVSD